MNIVSQQLLMVKNAFKMPVNIMKARTQPEIPIPDFYKVITSYLKCSPYSIVTHEVNVKHVDVIFLHFKQW